LWQDGQIAPSSLAISDRGRRTVAGLVYLSFALGTADAVDELSGVIAAAGYKVLEPPQRTCEVGCYESVVLDPDGNRLKLTV
jgi:lactoylglutathione lyase